MGIGARLSTLMDINDTNANELARKIGVSPQTIYSIIKRDSKKADIEVLLKIADIFGVTAEYFVSENDSMLPTNELYSKKDYEHLKAYCSLDPTGQAHVDTVLKWEVDRMKQIEQTPAAIVELHNGSGGKGRLIDYYRSVSAGSGQVIFEDVYADRILMPDIPEYRKVAYAVKVNGKSMEPRYNDGDILLIEPTCEIETGEIGIFNVDGKAYVKKLGKEKLISLNKGYEDIPLTEDSLCMGRVVGKL